MNANTWLVIVGGAGVILMAWAGVAVRSAWRQTLKEEAEKRERENLQLAVKSIEQLISDEQ